LHNYATSWRPSSPSFWLQTRRYRCLACGSRTEEAGPEYSPSLTTIPRQLKKLLFVWVHQPPWWEVRPYWPYESWQQKKEQEERYAEIAKRFRLTPLEAL
jgi:hypothetical protein